MYSGSSCLRGTMECIHFWYYRFQTIQYCRKSWRNLCSHRLACLRWSLCRGIVGISNLLDACARHLYKFCLQTHTLKVFWLPNLIGKLRLIIKLTSWMWKITTNGSDWTTFVVRKLSHAACLELCKMLRTAHLSINESVLCTMTWAYTWALKQRGINRVTNVQNISFIITFTLVSPIKMLAVKTVWLKIVIRTNSSFIVH